ncbi:hypothetical protein PCC7424_4599 [Gloeothece citriformis PCC 7424]|uniref:Sulfotransferase n=1 Tax=Gloeothece citriformis (strain PCC 7424) TaxID=65393 RepID=B7KAI7_GLOC7|nr:sulfotransferase [Gloeothece citriformis]ACK72961.1 hypothetical protein PCC7424_4599 [Gloeothece citriformis PCC 7424]
MKLSEHNDVSHHPIFIVGTPRSGTTLMQNILNKHSDLYIASETHYFSDLRKKINNGEQKLLTAKEIKLCEDYFLGLTHKWYGAKCDPEQGWMNRLKLRELANRIGLGTDAYFEAYCRLCAEKEHKKKWGEKTPRHIFEISTILDIYPQAKIICMIRHPGGLMASYRDWKNFYSSEKYEFSRSERKRIINSYNPALISLHWKAAFNAAVEACQKFGTNRVYIQRFEDLVSSPESTLLNLTEWLSLDYQCSMLNVVQLNSSYLKVWKDESRVGLFNEVAERWRQKLSDTEIATFQFFCGDLIEKAQYKYEPVKTSPITIVKLLISLPVAGFRTLVANYNRIGNLFTHIWPRLKLALFPALKLTK